MATKKKKPETFADLGKSALEIDKVYIIPDQATKALVEKLTPSPLDAVLAEIEEIKPKLKGLKHQDREQFGKLHERFLYLIAERDRLTGKTHG